MSQSSSRASIALRRYALTGGIGSGKHHLAHNVYRQGAFLQWMDCLPLSHGARRAVLARTVTEFGEHLLDEALNRPTLARIVW